MIVNSITELIGNTPMLRANNFKKKHNLFGNLILKLESFNPMSSVKDRIGLAMINHALQQGAITPKTTIIEPTSGNTGIALAFVCATMGLNLILTMSNTMSIERQKILLAFGAKLVLTEGEKGMKGAISKAEELHKEIENSIILQQFSNPSNPEIHKTTTAKEILNDLNNNINVFISAIGTGGTITGVGQVLKNNIPSVWVVAVEPQESPILSEGFAGPHKIQGIGAGFVPEVLNTSVYDEIITVNYNNAVWASRELAKTEGVLAGVSSGAALFAGYTLAQKEENKDKNIVIILPDSGERYLSTELFNL